MRYEGKLPSIRLNSKTLEELEKILLNLFSNKKGVQQKIEIKYEDWIKEYLSINELLKDPLKPKCIKEINWSLEGSDGTMWIYGHENFPTSLEINGKDKWVKNVHHDIYEFARKHKSIAGSIANNIVITYISLILGELLIIYGINIFKIDIFTSILLILIGCILSVFWITQQFFQKYAIPYFLIEFEENINRKRIEQIIIGIIASIFSVGILYLLHLLLKILL